jgi:hypothetical protein
MINIVKTFVFRENCHGNVQNFAKVKEIGNILLSLNFHNETNDNLIENSNENFNFPRSFSESLRIPLQKSINSRSLSKKNIVNFSN